MSYPQSEIWLWIKDLFTLVRENYYQELCHLGDFNFPDTDWRRIASNNGGAQIFLDVISDKFLHQTLTDS